MDAAVVPAVPSGMTAVSQEEFFQRLYADPRDIMPSNDFPNWTGWRVVATGEVWGWSAPGWRNVGSHEKVWAVKT
jgi:hypothetical protein